jgi:hypothetical protein
MLLSMSAKIDPADYSMIIKHRGDHQKPWRWEIHCAGHRAPVDRSPVYFETMTTAHRAGKEAIKLFLAQLIAGPARPIPILS